MPRPGPRPYECVRRAWHSDRHQPIRGSLIQEIFRVVNEIHSSATKKNKEWQEKLPVVVLRAEEIMYSKANSEAEYMDLKTLWDRVNDAINTIIRRDESTETGNLLHPCIEAALNLGCTPRRTSRSQRNISPRYYLCHSGQEQNAAAPGTLENTSWAHHSSNLSNMSRCPNFVKPAPTNSTPAGLDHNMALPAASASASIFPMYYQKRCLLEPQQGFGVAPKLSADSAEAASASRSQSVLNSKESDPEHDCDLSLRLGPLLVSSSGAKNGGPQEVEDDRVEVRKPSALLVHVNKEFSFFPARTVKDPSVTWDCEGEHAKKQGTMRKRKAGSSEAEEVEDLQICWQPKLPCNHLTGKLGGAGP